MCICSSKSVYGVDQIAIKKSKQQLPKLMQQRQQIKNIQAKQLFNWKTQALLRKADLVFHNGTIYTMEEDNPIAQAIAVINDRIIAVGLQVEVMKKVGPNTRVINLQGKTLLPGFIDPHIHMCFSSISRYVQLSPFIHKDADQVYQTIVKTVKNAKQNQWVLFQLYDPMITQGTIDISRKALDKICDTNPIFIYQANGHIAHANSKAFQITGINKDSPDPCHGRFVRDINGQLTGQIQQAAVDSFTKIIPKTSYYQYLNSFQKFLSHASSKGCTTLHDCAIGIVGPDIDLSILYQVFKDDAPVRYSGYLLSSLWDEWMKKNIKPEFKDTNLRINGIKCIVDGSTQAGTAYLSQPYLKAIWGNGFARQNQQDLNHAVLRAQQKGFQVGIHANGDAGIQMVLNAFENANKKSKRADLRHRIQHCTVCPKTHLIRMKKLNVSPSFLIGHIYFYGAAFRDYILGQQRSKLIDPMRSAIDCGLIPTTHSDYNCQPIDPLRCIYNAVTRIMKANGEVLNQKQCITPYEAIKAMTINSAWQCHMDDIVGSLKVQKFADFVILEQDPMKIPQQQIINIKIQQTWKGGWKWYQG